MKLSFPTRKLKGSIRKAGVKVSKLNIDAEKFTVFGVSKVDGVCVTGKDIGKNLEGYFFFEGQKFAYNPYRINIGSIGLSKDAFIGLMSSAYVIFETDDSINNEFLLLYLKSALGINLIKWYGDRGGVRSALRFSDLEKIDFPKLSYKQQAQALVNIKAKQDSVNSLFRELNEQQNLIDKLRKNIFQEAIKGSLTREWRKSNPNVEKASLLLDRFEIEKKRLIADKKLKNIKSLAAIKKGEVPYQLPENWSWCRFGNIGSLRGGGTPSKANPQYWNGKILWVRPKDMKVPHITNSLKTITDKGCANSSAKMIDADSILFVVRGMILIHTFPVAINTRDVTINQDMKALSPFLKDMTEFIRVGLKGFSEYILKSVERSSHGTCKLPTHIYTNLLFPLPPLSEQKAIVSKVEGVMKICDELEAKIVESSQQANQLMQAVLHEAFTPRENIIRELIPDIDKYAQVAMATLKIENELKYNYGKVEKQKTGFLLQAIKNQPVPYTFEKSNFGTFSWELSNDLDTNPYLRKTKAGQGEVYEVKASKHQEVLRLLNAPENASFVQAVDELVQVYKMPLINAKTDQIELLNTVCKSILDTQSIDLETIYGYMQFWTIKQEGFNTKADKFKKPQTKKVLELVLKLGWEKKLITQ